MTLNLEVTPLQLQPIKGGEYLTQEPSNNTLMGLIFV